MKVLIDSYNTLFQSKSGGVQVRLNNHIKYLKYKNVYVKKFDKWNDLIDDFDIIHIFKINLDTYSLVHYCRKKNIRVVASSVIALEKKYSIYFGLFVSKFFKIKTGYWFVKSILESVDVVVAQTILEANFIEKVYSINLNKIKIIPNGININFDENNKSLQLKGVDLGKPYVLQVGRFDKNKNQLNVIKALNGSGIQVIFVGGEYFDEKQYFCECKELADSNFIFLDWIKSDDPLLQSLYLNAKVVVLPSHKEIFGNSLFEGGAAGANLVVTDVLPIESWKIEKYCTKLNPNNINSIKAAILKAYHADKDNTQSDFFKENFSWDASTNSYLDIYKSLLSNE